MGSVRLGRIFGIEIRLDWSWFLVFFLLVWSLSRGVFPRLYRFGPQESLLLGIAAAVLLFASVLVHELAHALVARRFGTQVAGITLFLFGGVAQIKGEPESPRAEFYIAGAGPLTSIAIGLGSLGLARFLAAQDAPEAAAALFHYLGWINLVLAVFNLVPGFPLDGGRLLRSVIWQVTGSLAVATRVATFGGKAVAWVLIFYGLFVRLLLFGDLGGLWLVFIGWFLNNAAEASYQQLLLRRALRGVHVGDVMSRDIPWVDADLPVQRFVDDYLLWYDHTVYPVAEEGRFIGVVCVDDVRRLPRDAWPVTPVRALAHAPERERVVRMDQDAWDALAQMMENDIPRLLVMQNGRLDGIVSRDAIVRLVQRKMRLGLAG